jgi:hypothetical protein
MYNLFFDIKLVRLIAIATREVARIGTALYHCLLTVPTLFFASHVPRKLPFADVNYRIC